MGNSKGSILIVGLVVTALIFISAVVIFQRQKKSPKVDQNQSNMASREPSTADEPRLMNRDETTLHTRATDWQTYTDPNTGFRLRYPPSISRLYNDDKVTFPYPIPNLIASVYSRKLDTLGTRSAYADNRTYALAELKALEQGQFGERNAFLLPATQKVLKIGPLYAKSYIVFGRYDNCDKTFQRVLRFYLNGHQIEIGVYGPTAEVVNDMPQYFDWLNSDNSLAGVCWKPGSTEDLYEKLTVGRAPVAAQRWYNAFDDLISTIQLPHVKK